MGVTLDGKTLFELPIYRLSEKEYYQEFKKYYDKNKISNENPKIEEKLKEKSFKKFGGQWKYNEIIGYLRFYLLGNDIRCYSYKTDVNKIVRTRRKIFIPIDDTLRKITIRELYDNETIKSKIKEMVTDCEESLNSKKRYLDTEIFENLIDHMDWKSLIKSLK